ncbi:MAG TPA: HEAT repeat domain-containing protein, partial [Candidatus Ozemobacteraceae bacterium]|nr:HEAT repeat domain-containing protein [Candidatus Ozemobacteraceae bacterium]
MADINLKRLLRDLANPDDDLRALSAMTLMKVEVLDQAQREELFTALMKATRDKNIAVRFFSRRAIDKLRQDKDMEEGGAPAQRSIDAGLSSEAYEDRLQAVMRIARENKSDYKDRLVAMLQTEHHDFVKASLISCLKLFLNKSEANILSPFLKDPDSRVRSNTIEALEALKADGAIPLLFPCLEDTDNRIRAVAAKALQSFGEGKVFAVLKKMLGSNDEWMKFSAIHALSHINAGASIQMLVDAAKPPTQPDTRLRAIVALANFHDLTSYGFLKHLVSGNEEP